MRKLLYVFVGLFILGLIGANGSNDKGANVASNSKVSPNPKPCVVTLDKFLKMKEGMSYYQIERDIGCAPTPLSSSAIGNIKTVMVSWNGSGSFGANMNATFQNDILVGKAQFGLK